MQKWNEMMAEVCCTFLSVKVAMMMIIMMGANHDVDCHYDDADVLR